jgi:hypothetical protein
VTRSRSVRTVTAAVVALFVAGGALALARADQADGLSRARHLLADDHRFVNGPHAGTAFADASQVLLGDAKACARRRSSNDRRCSARFSAAAFTSVAAFALVDCTQPGVYRARRDALDQLDAVADVDRHRGAAVPPAVPAVPAC